MNAYKKLLKNSGLFAIANLGSKFISILLVPFYTYVLNTDQYGTVDLITTTVSLILPVITLGIYEATLRFSVKMDYKRESIFTSSIIMVAFGSAVFLIFYPILNKIKVFDGYFNIFYFILIFQAINTTFSQFARGIGKVKVFAVNGVINTIVTVIFNIVLLAKFNRGIEGYLISILLANIACSVYIAVALKVWKYFRLKYWKIEIFKEMLIYSIPLMPTALMWWVMNLSDRYIILFTLGASSNGIYAVANKVPTILNIINSVFAQAWQLSAIEEGDSKNKSKFYTNVFDIFSITMLIGVSAILVVIKPIIQFGLSESFSISWRYMPFLLIGVVFSSFSSFLGTNYVAMKKTKGALTTSAIGAVLNILLNLILTPRFGLNGTAISTMISFFIVWVIRIFDTREFVTIKLNIKSLAVTISLISIQICILFFNNNVFLNCGLQLILFILILVFNISIFSKVLYRIKENISRKNIKI